MKLKSASMAGVAILTCLGACTDFDTTRTRSALLNSPGPVVSDAEVDSYLNGVRTVRRFYAETATFGAGSNLSTPTGVVGSENKVGVPVTADRLRHTRTLILAYVDSRCDAYLDAIFWANRTRQGVARGNNAIGSAVSSILGATGTPTHVMGIVAAAFGLSGNLFDAYYESVLYGLEPSGVRHLVDQSQLAYRSRLSVDVGSEAILLQQVQDYIRQCTPSHIEFLVASALKKAGVVAQTPDDTATILFIEGWQVKATGTVVDPTGKVYNLGDTLPSPPFTLLDDGKIKIGGKTVDYKAAGLALWGAVPKAGAAPAAAGAAPGAVAPKSADPKIVTDIAG